MALDLNDKTANGNNLTNVNTVTEVTVGLPFAGSTSAADFERDSSQHFTADDSVSLSITSDLTIETWVKFESIGSEGYVGLVSKGTNTGDLRSYLFSQQANAGDDKLSLFISSTGANNEILQVTWNPVAGTWYHVAVTWDASAATAKFYVDGVQQGADQTGALTAIFNSTVGVELGGDNFGTNYFDGQLDDVRIWNDIRTVTEIDDNKSVEQTGSEDNLVAYWPFEALTTTVDPNVSDSITVTDTPKMDLEVKINKSESITVADAQQAPETAVNLNVSDSITVTDTPVMDLEIKANVSDSITITDTPTVLITNLVPNVLETITVTESVVMNLEIKANVSDSITVTDTPILDLEIRTNVSDSITVTDTPKMDLEIKANVSDSVTLSESLIMNLVLMPQLSESITVTDTDSV